jgi:hypothetical protein
MLHTVEIAQRPVAIINAPRRVAEEWTASEAFKQDLRALGNTHGEAVVRAARDEEIAKWDAARIAGDADEEDKAGYFVFLDANNGAARRLRPVRA